MAINLIKFDFDKAQELQANIVKNRAKLIDCLGELSKDVADTEDWWKGDSHDAFLTLLTKNSSSIEMGIDASEKEMMYVKNVSERKKNFEATERSRFI